MAWESVGTHVDEETGVSVVKQRRQRNGRGNETRYLVQITEEKYVYVRRTELFKMTDALDDVCDLIEEGKF